MYTGFIGGTSLLATGLVLWLLPRDQPEDRPAISVGLLPVREGALLSVGGSW
jgi:hypothetical protein